MGWRGPTNGLIEPASIKLFSMACCNSSSKLAAGRCSIDAGASEVASVHEDRLDCRLLNSDWTESLLGTSPGWAEKFFKPYIGSMLRARARCMSSCSCLSGLASTFKGEGDICVKDQEDVEESAVGAASKTSDEAAEEAADEAATARWLSGCEAGKLAALLIGAGTEALLIFSWKIPSALASCTRDLISCADPTGEPPPTAVAIAPAEGSCPTAVAAAEAEKPLPRCVMSSTHVPCTRGTTSCVELAAWGDSAADCPRVCGTAVIEGGGDEKEGTSGAAVAAAIEVIDEAAIASWLSGCEDNLSALASCTRDLISCADLTDEPPSTAVVLAPAEGSFT